MPRSPNLLPVSCLPTQTGLPPIPATAVMGSNNDAFLEAPHTYFQRFFHFQNEDNLQPALDSSS